MKIWTIARNTLSSFLRDRVIILLFCGFLCIVLLMMTPLWAARAMTTVENKQVMQSTVNGMVSAIMGFVSGCGSLLAAWSAADSVATEMKSGTILAVVARPLNRWEFLAGKYLGVLLLMLIYTLSMLGLSFFLAWLGGERIQASPWILVVYPMVRYSLYAAISMLLVTFMHPVAAVGLVIVTSVVSSLLSSNYVLTSAHANVWRPFYYVFPSLGFISEDKFLALTKASLVSTSAVEHLTVLGYGLDYALVFFLLAVWSFHYRNLKRD
ncbi:MAG TPA: ABC transporter permease [Verrucomicrobiae bacterium]|nr:ABC transporter permease [Verrucomicrobiae bacterium]